MKPMEKTFSVAVIVPIYNGEADLPDLIACLESQTYPSEFVHYYLVDNNSTDKTAEIIQQAAIKNPQIKLVSEPKIQSSYAARNAGIHGAEDAEIFAFTDADCRPESTWLEQLIQPFYKSEIGLSVGEIKALPGNSLLEKYSDYKDVLSQKYTLENKFCPYGQTANLAIRQSVFAETGLFRPYLTTGGDADICWRILRETAWQYEFVETAVVRHRHRATFKEYQSQWRRYGKSNRYLHEIHGVELMRVPDQREYFYRLTRWILKEVPKTSFKLISGKAQWIELLDTPLGLVGLQARSQGQEMAKLPPEAKEIESFKAE